jgi:hypothetical protein
LTSHLFDPYLWNHGQTFSPTCGQVFYTLKLSPKDKGICVIPLIPKIRSPGISNCWAHITLAVPTRDRVGNRQETRTLQLYDASFNIINQSNRQLILDRLVQCKVGGLRSWRLPKPEDRFYDAPNQSKNLVVVACCCFCLWRSGAEGFH